MEDKIVRTEMEFQTQTGIQKTSFCNESVYNSISVRKSDDPNDLNELTNVTELYLVKNQCVFNKQGNYMRLSLHRLRIFFKKSGENG